MSQLTYVCIEGTKSTGTAFAAHTSITNSGVGPSGTAAEAFKPEVVVTGHERQL